MRSKILKVIETAVVGTVLTISVVMIAYVIRPYGHAVRCETRLDNGTLIEAVNESYSQRERIDSSTHCSGPSTSADIYIANPRPYVRQPMNSAIPFDGSDNMGRIKVPPMRERVN